MEAEDLGALLSICLGPTGREEVNLVRGTGLNCGREEGGEHSRHSLKLGW